MKIEIIKTSTAFDFEYMVDRALFARPAAESRRELKPGELIKFDDKTLLSDILGFCQRGKLHAVIPEVTRYRARLPFSFPVCGRIVEVKIREVVEMRDSDAWYFLLSQHIRPIDPDVWCPERLLPPKPKSKEQIQHEQENIQRIWVGCKPRIGYDYKVSK